MKSWRVASEPLMHQAEYHFPNRYHPLIRQRTFDFEITRTGAARAIAPLKPADKHSVAPKDMLFSAKRTDAGRQLPAPYLVYFLLVDLLGYRNLGRWEKLAYSIPVDFNGTAYLVEHRKFGLGLFAADPEAQEADARVIVRLIQKAVKAARPYFQYLADEAAKGSKLNVANHSRSLYERFSFLRKTYVEKTEEAESRKDERIVKEGADKGGQVQWKSVCIPAFELRREARWLGMSAVEAFFSWTEHVFIHIAILNGVCTTGREVSTLASADWSEKFRAALDVREPETKALYDELIAIRRQLRNHMAHGAFGKDGQAFSFHSNAGAVPLLLPYRKNKESFRFGSGADLDPSQAFDVIARFESCLWSGPRASLKQYIQEYELPAILSMSADGTYERARSSYQEMVNFTERLATEIDNAANMDW